jgi:hypothetical protein
VNRSGEFCLLVGEIALRIIGELLTQNKDAVEWRSEFMTHVRKKFGLVFRSQRQFRRLFLNGAASAFDFLIFGLHLDIALGELLGLLFELIVGLLQLALLRLQLGRKLLGLHQQALGTHCGFDGVEDNADAIGELLQKSGLQIGESRQRCKLDYCLYLALEKHRQYHDGLWRRFEQCRSDGCGAPLQAGYKLPPLVHRTLPDLSFAETDSRGVPLACVVRVTRE